MPNYVANNVTIQTQMKKHKYIYTIPNIHLSASKITSTQLFNQENHTHPTRELYSRQTSFSSDQNLQNKDFERECFSLTKIRKQKPR